MKNSNFFMILVLAFQGGIICQDKSKKPPKIVTKDGNLMLQAGEGGDIVLQPDDGQQVRIGSFVLRENSTNSGVEGPKGEKGDPGVKGVAGLNGQKGNKGDVGSEGVPGKNGSNGERGEKGERGVQGFIGPPGPKGERENMTSVKRCNGSSDFGQMMFSRQRLKVCTSSGWKTVSFQDDLCLQPTVPRVNLDYFKQSNFGILLQFNGDLKVNLSPQSAAKNINVTAVYQNTPSNVTTPVYVDAVMDKSIRITGQQYIDLIGLPTDLWASQEWSVMTLIKIGKRDVGNQDTPVIGAGTTSNNKGFHLGIRSRHPFYGFYSNDFQSNTQIDYDQWYQITWTWKKSPKTRKIFVNGVQVAKDSPANQYQGTSDNTQIGTWWNSRGHPNTNIEIDTLFIVNKAVDYVHVNNLVCEAKAVEKDMP